MRNVTFVCFVGLIVATASLSHAAEHRRGRKPVVVDGIFFSAEAAEKAFGDQQLRYVLDPIAASQGVIYAFTTEEGALDRIAWLGANLPESPAEAPLTALGPGFGQVALWDNTWYSGSSLVINAGNSLSSLGSMDNRTESVSFGSTGLCATLYENTGFGGSCILIWNYSAPNLGTYGWANRASSVRTNTTTNGCASC